ncbi:tetratricopeptide repeat protein [Bacillus sp. B1-b2]|uniref:tetratricopeptide repeat protein n=1 Tax=Bacillus sp. B1-b2 TaxID=2653201 RepID=UPI00299F86E0|nr:tetratricopeptide repeat protein [Bacillus sp. B1-b2]
MVKKLIKLIDFGGFMNNNSRIVQPVGKLIPFNPTGEYYFSKGIKAYHQRDYYKSLKYLKRALALEPGEPMIACQLAIVYADIGEYQKSNELLHLIIEELDENMEECYYFLANNYAHLGFFKDAYYHAKLYLSLTEEDGEFVEETEDLMEILSLESDELEEEDYHEEDLISRQDQARTLLESGNFSEAADALTRVVKDYPEYWSAHNNLALAYFYLGDTKKANDILDQVLQKNMGNLHALCNKLVFAYYENNVTYRDELVGILRKINPISIDHQFKLGTTFALIKEYDLAYHWLGKIYKHGFQGDGSFYYWLAYSAYFTGKEQTAKRAWKMVLQHNPEKDGQEPWSDQKNQLDGFENHLSSILKRLESEHLEERLFAAFLTYISSKKEDILSSLKEKNLKPQSGLEKEYLAYVLNGEEISNPYLVAAHHTAMNLYHNNQPIGIQQASMYLTLFSVFTEMQDKGILIKNYDASAAAIEYLWYQYRQKRKSQQQLANQYGVSTSTIQKYVKMMKPFLTSAHL